MANWPPVDPTDLADAEHEELMNRATGFTYEPGSTFKAFTVAAALEERLVTPEHRPSPWRRRSRSPTGRSRSRTRGTETLTVAEILAQSSNVGAVTIGLEARRRANSATGSTASASASRPGSSSRARSRASCPTLDEYSGSTIGNLPIGQGLSVTPMQMVAGYTAIANGGILRPPQLIKRIGDEAGPRAEGQAGDQPEVAAEVREMLEGVLGAGRHRLGGQRPRLHARRQDRHRADGRRRRLLGDQVRRLVHRLRPGRRTRSCWSR